LTDDNCLNDAGKVHLTAGHAHSCSEKLVLKWWVLVNTIGVSNMLQKYYMNYRKQIITVSSWLKVWTVT